MSSKATSTSAPTLQGMSPTPTARPTIIGIYGVSGCGKSYLLKRLSEHFKTVPQSPPILEFSFYDSSRVLADQVPGGLSAFKDLAEEQRESVRKDAIKRIQTECSTAGKAGVIAGHYSFWCEGSSDAERVMTAADRSTYTHIVYLDPPADVVSSYRQTDADRRRPSVSVGHLRRWMELEKSELRDICFESGILFSVLSSASEKRRLQDSIERLQQFGCQVKISSEQVASTRLEDVLGRFHGSGQKPLETAIVLDGDKTISPEDSGTLFWNLAAKTIPGVKEDSLKALFGSKPGYSHTAFEQAALLYKDVSDSEVVSDLCSQVASQMSVYPEVAAFLQAAAKQEHVAIIVATCGQEAIWRSVLQSVGDLQRVGIIGTGCDFRSGVVTPETKRDIVLALQQRWGLTTWVFGDSPIDVPMLRVADYPVVVVGNELIRSKSMEYVLSEAVSNGLEARQVLLPMTVSPRLNTARLPIAQLTDPEFMASIFHRRGRIDLVHATEKAASKILMTPTRDTAVSGPHLRDAHERVGYYLATELVTECIGIESFPITHVTGDKTEGFRLKDEAKTLVVALMRAGEPMALGVSRAFPTAMFLHANKPSDLTVPGIKEASTILLVDGVVNKGTTAVKFMRHIRRVDPNARIVIVAGVVQSRCVVGDGGNQFSRLSREDKKLSLVALRISENQYSGRGTVDTGNRLFNTTHLP